ncbi:hypothetical protein C8F04DRAFT_1277159 [Mycena alexandri]|uniref:Uncharacterized protein n=1 Tax=Mycena alexandri TaxID=1745969 RepID=A0AAD6WRZ8_9AGAR|nr:hypothetical protein C8F04DRAFT_1277159 [Mycena alexandri]
MAGKRKTLHQGEGETESTMVVQGPAKQRKDSHRSRGSEAAARRLEKYAHNGMYENACKKIKELTGTFAGLTPYLNSECYTQWRKSCLSPTPEQLQKQGPAGELRQLKADGLPPWLAIRLAHIIPIPLLNELLHLWDHLVSMGLKFPKLDPNRSHTVAVHLSVWGLFGWSPRITKGITNRAKREAVLRSMDKMLWFLTKRIVRQMENALDEIIPEHARLQDCLRAHAKRLLCKEFNRRPSLNFGGLFFTVAIKEGASERIHINWNNCLQKYALIFCAGNYTGADFCIPQLNIHIPLGPGSVLAVRTRLLAHCATLVGSGRQVVFTRFTDDSEC